MAKNKRIYGLLGELKRERTILAGVLGGAVGLVKRAIENGLHRGQSRASESRAKTSPGAPRLREGLARDMDVAAERVVELRSDAARRLRTAARDVERRGDEVARTTRALGNAAEKGVSAGTTAAKRSLAGSKAHKRTPKSRGERAGAVKAAARQVRDAAAEVEQTTRAATRAAETGLRRGTTAAKRSLAASKARTKKR